MGRSEVSTSVVRWSEGLSNSVSIIIRIYRSYEVCCYMAVSFITFFHILFFLFCIILYTVVCFVGYCLIL